MLTRNAYDLLLLDLALPGESGIDLLPRIKALRAGAAGHHDHGVRHGGQRGGCDPRGRGELRPEAVGQREAAGGHSRRDRQAPRRSRRSCSSSATLKQRYNFENIVGKSEPMLRLFDLVAQVAPSRSTVLIQGESGTGKELIAKAIHANSPRRDKPFIPVNTGAVPSDLLESTLFGHVARRVHLGRRGEEGAVRSGRRRDAVPRRDRHHGHGHAGEDSARAAGPALHASGRHAGDPGGRADRRRDQREPAAGGARKGASAKTCSTG